MKYSTVLDKNNNTTAEISEFCTENGISEYHIIIRITEVTLSFSEQLKSIFSSLDRLLTNELHSTTIAFQRIFLSDAANQTDSLLNYLPDNKNNISIIEQPPLNGTKIALWAYLLKGAIISQDRGNGLHELQHGKYTHLWKCSAAGIVGDSEKQTQNLLNDYTAQMGKYNCTLYNNCIRTWIFVHNVDTNYQGVVKARREIFAKNNLTEKTHFIASTGIGGRHKDKETLVVFDFYTINGICEEQIQYLYAKTHLNSTYEYGVTFERGTCVHYGDRRHVFISGTASINNKGEILHGGNVKKQAIRMLENVDTLLKEAECGFEDIAQMIIYLRDIADYQVTKNIIETQFPMTPKIIVLAPVCRSGWLIEMECIAIKKDKNERFEPL